VSDTTTQSEHRAVVVMRKDGKLFREITKTFEDRDRAQNLTRPEYAMLMEPFGYQFVESYVESRETTPWERTVNRG
jgi:hypothetical protein